MVLLFLPRADGSLERVSLTGAPALDFDVLAGPPTSRVAYAAVHVVADPLASAPGRTGAIDWDATIAVRKAIWDLGLGVAESMDTAQRGMGLGAADAMELADRTLAADPRGGAGVAVGVGTDALEEPDPSLVSIVAAYLAQVHFVRERGGTPVIMASRQLASVARRPEDYLDVYRQILRESDRKVILHWLGAVFDPALTGYWGHPDPKRALDTVSALVDEYADRVAGIKISLLDPALELALRERVPGSVAVFTGDDFNYTDMIAGDESGHSHALLGAFAALAPWASAALNRLDHGDPPGFRAILEPTQALSRLVFQAPTQYYKVGIAWLAYLRGDQSHFRMIGGLESGRSLLHLADVVREAARLGYFADPELAADRARRYFAVHGIG